MTLSRRAFALAVAVFVVGVLRYLPVLQEPWSHSFGDMNSTEYTTRFVKTFERVGFEATDGVPHFWALPMKSGAAWGPYRHHPPLHSWMIWGMVRLFGFTEAACRLAPILLSALAFAAVSWLIVRWQGMLLGAAAGLLAVSIPMGFEFGSMVNPESAVLGLSMLTVALHEGCRRGAWWRHALAVGAAQFLAFQMDWQAAFFGFAIVVRELLTHRDERRILRTFAVIVGSGLLSGLLTIRLLAGHLEFVDSVEFLINLSANEVREDLDWGLWLRNQGRFWTVLMGWPLTLTSVVSLPILFRSMLKMDGAAERLTLMLAVPAVANVVAFSRHSVDHDFWWFYALPFVVMAPIVSLRRLRVPRGIVAVVTLIIAAHAATLTMSRHAALRTDEFRTHGVAINDVAGPNDYLITPVSLGRAGFYVDAWLHDGPDGLQLESLRLARLFLDAGHMDVERIVAVVPAAYPLLSREAVRDLGEVVEMDDGGFRLIMTRR